jgi:hypothetical protein
MTRQTWVQDPSTGKLIPKEQYQRGGSDAPYIQGDIADFVSPIDGRVISDRGQLRRHMAEHGVTNSQDYSPAFLLDRSKKRDEAMMGNTRQDKADRIDLIRRALDE